MGTSTREEAGEDENEKSSGGGDGDSQATELVADLRIEFSGYLMRANEELLLLTKITQLSHQIKLP